MVSIELMTIQELDKKIMGMEEEIIFLRKIVGKKRKLSEFWRNVEKTDLCWNWKGRLCDGYGSLSWGGRSAYSHRVAFELLTKKPTTGLVIDHICKNRKCVNPAHLREITNRENILIGESPSAINSRKTHCRKGHEYSIENTYRIHRSDGRVHRTCRICSKEINKKYWRKKYGHQVVEVGKEECSERS